jgi:peptidoglycan/LPS O-acetylase OafA/YrhL
MWSADLGVREMSARDWARLRWGFAGLSLVLAVLTWLNRDEAPRVVAVQVMCGLVGLWAAVGLALLRHGSLAAIKRACSWRPATYFGGMGFTIYLIHAPIAELVNQYIIARSPWSDNLRALLMPPIYLACTLAVAIPFFHLFERPLHALSRRQWLRPVPVDDAVRFEAQKL